MFRYDGQDMFVIDGHTHFWDARPANWRNQYGESWIKCFYGYHSALSPSDAVWTFEKFCHYGEQSVVDDLFRNGYVDMAILNSTYLREFYNEGFNTHAQNYVIKEKYPDRFLLCGSFDPRDEENGLDAMRRMMTEYPISGLKLYTAEWRGSSRGWRLNDLWSYKYLELAQKLGIKNVHVHKGPTVYPLSSDAFDVRDVDHAATDFPGLNFIVEHVGLPRLEDFCWIAVQEANVYAGLSVAMAFVHLRPHYFGEIMANLLFWLGPDRLCFGSDYAIWTPKWLIEKFMDYQMPDDLKQEYHVDLTLEVKRKILGENTARLYGIDVAKQAAKLQPA
jgi:predicted TIM-barrel fold metal-dependent hydrolase